MHASRSLLQAVRWPFLSRYTAPLWFALRLYLGWIWLQFGASKIEGGWLTGNPLGDLLGAVASGNIPLPVPAYARIAEMMVGLGMDHVLSVAIPLFEIAVAVAFFSGVLLVPAAGAAILLNANLIRSGVASLQFDGRIIVLQLLLMLAWRVAGALGAGPLVAMVRKHRPRPLAPVLRPRHLHHPVTRAVTPPARRSPMNRNREPKARWSPNSRLR